jgi:hypothetical protein
VLQLRNNFKSLGRIRKVAALGAAVAAVAGALVSSKPASATAAGLTFYPSTDIYSKGNFHFDADYFFNEKARFGSDASTFGLSYGVGPETDGAFGRSEVGFDYVTNSGDLSVGKRLSFNAKTQLYNNDDSQTRVVAGIWGLGSRSASAPNVGYLLGSRNFEFGRIHVGVARALRDVVGDDRNFIQLGYDKVFADGKLQFTTDYYSGKSAISALAPGIIYYLNDKAAVQLGYIRYNNRDLGEQIYFGFDYNFGGSSNPTPGTAAEGSADAPAPETSTSAPAVQ